MSKIYEPLTKKSKGLYFSALLKSAASSITSGRGTGLSYISVLILAAAVFVYRLAAYTVLGFYIVLL